MCETIAVSAISLTSSSYDSPVQRCISPCSDRYPSNADHGRVTMSTIAFLFCDDSSSKWGKLSWWYKSASPCNWQKKMPLNYRILLSRFLSADSIFGTSATCYFLKKSFFIVACGKYHFPPSTIDFPISVDILCVVKICQVKVELHNWDSEISWWIIHETIFRFPLQKGDRKMGRR